MFLFIFLCNFSNCPVSKHVMQQRQCSKIKVPVQLEQLLLDVFGSEMLQTFSLCAEDTEVAAHSHNRWPERTLIIMQCLFTLVGVFYTKICWHGCCTSASVTKTWETFKFRQVVKVHCDFIHRTEIDLWNNIIPHSKLNFKNYYNNVAVILSFIMSIVFNAFCVC